MKCIDAHLHIFERMTGYAFMGEFRPLGNGRVRWASGAEDLICTPDMGDTGVSAESMIRFMDQNEIEMGVLLQGSAYGFHNEYIAESVEKYPDRFIGTATIDPFFREFDMVLDRLMGELKFSRFKLEMSATGGLCGFHDENMLWNHKNLDKLCSRLNDIHGTLSLDIGMPGTVSHRIGDVKRFAEKYPDLNIIVCHLCSMPADAEETLKSVREELQKAKDESETLTKEKAQLQAQLERLTSDHDDVNKALSEEAAQLRTEAADLTAEIVALQTELSEKEEALKAAAETEQKYKALSEENGKLSAALTQARQDADARAKTIETLSQQAEAAQKREAEYAALEASSAQANQALEASRQETEALRQKLTAESEALKAELAAAQETIAAQNALLNGNAVYEQYQALQQQLTAAGAKLAEAESRLA